MNHDRRHIIVENLEFDYNLRLDEDFDDLQYLCHHTDCPNENCTCWDDLASAVERQLREQEREQILKDIDSYNREWHRNHWTDGMPIVVNQNDDMIVVGALS